MENPREIVLKALLKQEDSGYSNIVIGKFLEDALPHNKALITTIFYGVIQNQITLDYQINLHLVKKKSLSKILRNILRIGAYQLLYMNKIPPNAAVDETVNLIKKTKESPKANFVNAILRKISALGKIMLPPQTDKNYNSIKYSIPIELFNMMTAHYGEQNIQIFLENSLKTPPLYLRVNSTKTTSAALKKILLELNIESEIMPFPDNCLKINKIKNLFESPPYKNGFFHVQDISSQICCELSATDSTQNMLDLCSAPGGKSFTIAQNLSGIGKILSCDINPKRLKLVSNGAKRLGLSNITTLENDAAMINPNLGLYDSVLCDVVCSGFGVISRKPEIKYKNLDELKSLPEIGLGILKNASRYVSKNGILTYSTCTLNKKENEKVIEKFLAENHEFIPKEIPSHILELGISCQKFMLTLLPTKQLPCDGFFMAQMIKK